MNWFWAKEEGYVYRYFLSIWLEGEVGKLRKKFFCWELLRMHTHSLNAIVNTCLQLNSNNEKEEVYENETLFDFNYEINVKRPLN